MRQHIIVDVDGTLADASHRKHHIKPTDGKRKDYKSFYAAVGDDSPIHPVINLVRSLHTAGNTILITSGRPEGTRVATVDWLHAHAIPFHELFMRGHDDFRPDFVVKREILNDMRLAGFRPTIAIDDRDQVVRMWREEGIICLQCAEGNF